jgi:phosphate transport system substrate-binding protein
MNNVKFVLLCLFIFPSSYLFGTEIDERITDYKKVPGISGSLNSVGSDTLNNLVTLWSEGFRKIYPSVKTQIEGKGSSTAPPALIEGTSQLGPMSRAMKTSELEKFEKKYGFKPTRFIVALDGLVVIVNKDNPIEELSLPEVDAIFSLTLKGGREKPINKWGDLGLKAAWEKRNISLYGRNSASGTYGYFKSAALFKGDYRKNVKEQPGSASVVQSIGVDRYAIGYSGIGFLTSNIKPIKIAKKQGEKYYSPLKYENIISGKYPLARGLNIYVVKDPKRGIDPVTKEFLKYVFSRQGQEVVIKDGYLPLSYKLVEKYSKLLK